MQAWPNPARDELHVRVLLPASASASRLVLIATDGWAACGMELDGDASEKYITIPVSGLPAGSYLVRLLSGGRVDVRGVVVVR